MSVVRRIATNSLYQLFGKLIVLAVSLITVALLARHLGVSAYGTYTIAMAYSQLYAIMGDLGIGIYLLKRLSASESADSAVQKLLGSAAESRVVTAIGGSLLAIGITYFLPYGSGQRHLIAVAIIAVVLQMVNSLFITVFQARLEMRYAALGDIAARVITLSLVILALYEHQGVAAVIAAQIVGNLANLGITYWFAQRFIRPTYSFDPRQWQLIIRSSLLIGISSILSYIYFKTDTFLLSILPILGHTNAVEVGLYGAAYKFVDVLIIVPGVFLGTIFPLFSNALASQEHDKARLLIDRSFQVMLTAGFISCTGLYIFADFLIGFVAGGNFAAAAAPLRILAFAIPLNFVGATFSYALLALERQRSLAYLYGGAAVFNVLANLISIPHYSYLAAATTTVMTECIVTAGGAWLLHAYYPIRFRVLESGALVVLIGVIALVTYLIPAHLIYFRAAVFSLPLLTVAVVCYRRLLT